MFENESIFDKFSISSSGDGNQILTGNYNNNFHVIDLLDGSNTQYELNYKKQTVAKQMLPGKV
jgi:serine/threonine-protein phosphatase 2A regulatory subunit B